MPVALRSDQCGFHRRMSCQLSFTLNGTPTLLEALLWGRYSAVMAVPAGLPDKTCRRPSVVGIARMGVRDAHLMVSGKTVWRYSMLVCKADGRSTLGVFWGFCGAGGLQDPQTTLQRWRQWHHRTCIGLGDYDGGEPEAEDWGGKFAISSLRPAELTQIPGGHSSKLLRTVTPWASEEDSPRLLPVRLQPALGVLHPPLRAVPAACCLCHLREHADKRSATRILAFYGSAPGSDGSH